MREMRQTGRGSPVRPAEGEFTTRYKLSITNRIR